MKKLFYFLFCIFLYSCVGQNGNPNHGVKQLNSLCKNNKLADRFFCSSHNGQVTKLIFQSNCDFHYLEMNQDSTTPTTHLKGKWKLNQNQLAYTLNEQELKTTLIWSIDDLSFTTIEDQKVYNRCN